MSAPSNDSGRGTLADRLDHLFRNVHPPERGPYSNAEVASALRARPGGPTISPQYLWLLRRGDRDNPTMRHIEALAGFFGVPPGYFFAAHGGTGAAPGTTERPAPGEDAAGPAQPITHTRRAAPGGRRRPARI